MREHCRKTFSVITMGFGFALVLEACAEKQQPIPESGFTDDCPPWATDPADVHANDPSPHLGCANKFNLMNMVDRPADLVSGRPSGPANGNREALGVKAYEHGQVKPFKENNAPSQMILPSETTGGQ